MALFRQVYTEFWRDPGVIEDMTPEDKLFFLYLLTNPNTTQIGIYTITKKQMAFDIGYSVESVNALLDRFINHHKIVVYNAETREIAIKNWAKYNLTRAGKPMEDLVKKELAAVKDKSLISVVREKLVNEKFIVIFDEYLNSIRDDTRNVEHNVVCDDTRKGDNNNNNNNNNKNNNNNNCNVEKNKVVDNVDKLVVVGNKIKSYFPSLIESELKNIIDNFVSTNRDMSYLEEKLLLTKNTDVRSVAGFLIKAIREDYKPNKTNKVNNNVVKTKYHDTFNEHYKNYTEDELERKLLEVQNKRGAC